MYIKYYYSAIAIAKGYSRGKGIDKSLNTFGKEKNFKYYHHEENGQLGKMTIL